MFINNKIFNKFIKLKIDNFVCVCVCIFHFGTCNSLETFGKEKNVRIILRPIEYMFMRSNRNPGIKMKEKKVV